MRMMPLLAFLIVSVCCCGTTDRQGKAGADLTIPQAQPVATLLLAVREQDVDLFRSAYSSRMQAAIKKEGDWREGLQAYTELFHKEFGDYSLQDFQYSFSGDDAAGKVETTHGDRQLPGLRVAREGDCWKLDER